MADTHASIDGIGNKIFRLILGSATLSPPNKDYAYPLIDEFIRLGGNALETAHSYGDGDCERVIGRWVKERGNRERIVIVTKGGHPFDGRSRLSADCVNADLEESLRRLQTDYIDVYMLHRDDTTLPVGQIMENLNEHVRSGKVRALGASNWTVERIKSANAYAREKGLAPFKVGSPHFSLAVPVSDPWPGCLSVTKDDLAWYKTEEVRMLSWSSQARGFFTGRYSPERLDELAVLPAWFSPENFERLNRAKELAKQKGTTANSIALSYVLSQSFAPMAAIGCRSIDELRDTFEAMSCRLNDEEMKWLNLETKVLAGSV